MADYPYINLGKVVASVNGYNTSTLTVSAPMSINADGNTFNITLPAASSSTAGYMSVSDKLKLDGLPVFENLAAVNEGTELSLVTTGDKYRWNAAETKLDMMSISSNGISTPETLSNQHVASFTSAAAERPLHVNVNIQPMQAGSGNPYPPGGGKNQLDISNATIGVDKGITFSFVTDDAGNITGINANGVSTAANAQCTIEISDGSVYSNMILSGTPNNVGAIMLLEMRASPYTQYASDTGNGATIGSIPSGTECYFIIRFPNSGTTVTNVVFRPMIRRASDTDPAFAPYANIRPITGWTGISVARAGKNLLNYPNRTQTINGVTAVSANGVVTLSGTATALTQIPVAVKPPLPAGNYILTGCPEGGSLSTYDLRVADDSVDTGSGALIHAAVALYITVRQGINTDNLTFRPMIRLASETDSTFEPYQETITISFPSSAGTVYGGTLDVARGLLTVDRAYKRITDLSFRSSSTVNTGYFVGTLAGAKTISNSNIAYPFGMCDWFRMIAANEGYGYDSVGYSVSTNLEGYLWFGKTPELPDDKTPAEWIVENPVTIVYELATPITYQLTPQQISTLVGTNNVFADCGTVDVTYWPGTGVPMTPVNDENNITLVKNILTRMDNLETAIVQMGGTI